MTDHENIPYYHTNIDKNNKAAVAILTHLLEKYGRIKNSYVTIDGEQTPVLVDTLTWYDYKVFTHYTVEQFHEEYSLTYGNQFMLTTVETIDEEREIHAHVYHTSINDNGELEVKRGKTTLKRTYKHQQEYDAWWAKNRVKVNGIWVAVYPDTTDDIAYETELILGALETGEKILGRV